MATIEFNNVGRTFHQGDQSFVALKGVNLEVGDREFVAIVGPSGCGKTTCMRMAAGLEQPSAGNVRVDREVITKPGPDRAVVFQQFALFPWKTVWENIEFGLHSLRVPAKECTQRIEQYIALMGLSGYEKAFPHQLSGGMQQRVAIARAYVLDPKVLLMDEPFGALDAQTRVAMQEELVRLARRHPRTVLFITHAVDEAVYLADRVVVMSRRPGTVREIIDVKSIREAEQWDALPCIEDVMDQPAFVRLRTQIGKLLREQQGRGVH
ncbi:ABC transporter ATP-binding protein [Verminephrobacter aporrectodeae subsp. tuberculatae]|uniref:ABC transporter ATP-binding protein n=1 Tax=Verminephrobacter aporrectodeae subsp. tuberculatae TaxID=1110392 RepID=A0ABT3KV95_9BURK|nr:ABC transporter ATP-binding protein [Verminephrobacter aporrectodeae]MCW5256598.1 ABC transporter ATP-binding protein [Verminephrobacter aporrectodeae subsp. tuberculatae]MCW5322238.1 ABC transporter ATP-binding protein [Verminephrobacter aporrectodeae subsp. tuberculatae]MCW8199514.1 ABC transporter ATP-binding protein [Verminephrobacter aporrectodeae subsp. tuberculatae]MCW8208462.1 ABC transporter ATP-binding protein [Verminephrobacter aporrectodeae subsp. tuberculatae]